MLRQLKQRVDLVREVLKYGDEHGTVRDASVRMSKTIEEMSRELQMLKTELAAVGLREAQLRAVARADIAFAEQQANLDGIFADPNLAPHITSAVRNAQLHTEPFPYMIVDGLLPKPLYRALINALPPPELFRDRPANRQQLKVPFDFAPSYSRRVWGFMAETVGEHLMQPVVLEVFRPVIAEWLGRHFPAFENAIDRVTMHCSDGRILRRERGYLIPPHRDPKWGFITCLMYLARRGDSEAWGTQLYSVDRDEEAQGAAPHWIDPARCHLVQDVPFKKNRALIFVNSVGAHGAMIPENAEPADLDRYAYQFRIGPDARSIVALTATLPEARRAAWMGKLVEY